MTDTLQSLCRHSLLGADEERELIRLAQSGDRAARDRLIGSNTRLVVSIAQSHFRHGSGLDLDDLVGAGCLGLCVAVDRFDLAKSVRFATYATWWIRREVHDAIRGAT